MANEIELMKKIVMFTRQARMGMPGRGFHGAPHGAGGPCPKGHGMGPGPACPGKDPGMGPGPAYPGKGPKKGPGMGPAPVHPGAPGPMGKPPVPPMGKPPVPPFGKPGMPKPPLSREHLLVIISQYPDGVRQKVVADKVGINQSSASELINKLEATGYIERTIDPDDKRATLLFLTEKGKARAAEVEDERNEIFKDIFSVLTEEEKETLSGILDKLLAAQDKDHVL